VLTKAKKSKTDKRLAVIMEPKEKDIVTMLQQIQTIRKEKMRKRKLQKAEKREQLARLKAKEEEKALARAKKERKEYFREASKAEKRKASSNGVLSKKLRRDE
jgi:ribosome biogenesis protein BMS1